MTDIRGYSLSVAENSVSSSSDSSSYSDYSYSDYSDYSDYSYSGYSDSSDSNPEAPIVGQHAFKRYRPSFKQQPSVELPSQKEVSSAKAPRARRNSTEGRITWKLSDLALQKLTTEVFPRVAEGETAPVSNVRTLFEQAGIPAGIMTSTYI